MEQSGRLGGGGLVLLPIKGLLWGALLSYASAGSWEANTWNIVSLTPPAL